MAHIDSNQSSKVKAARGRVHISHHASHPGTDPYSSHCSIQHVFPNTIFLSVFLSKFSNTGVCAIISTAFHIAYLPRSHLWFLILQERKQGWTGDTASLRGTVRETGRGEKDPGVRSRLPRPHATLLPT